MKKILVVDDEPNYLRLLEVNSERWGFSVAKTENGVKALEQIREEQPDVVILDVFLKSVPDGPEVLRQIRTIDSVANVPIIVISGQDTADPTRFEGYRRGFDRYLRKPVDLDELHFILDRITKQNDAE